MKTKRILSVFVAVVMLVACLPNIAFAENTITAPTYPTGFKFGYSGANTTEEYAKGVLTVVDDVKYSGNKYLKVNKIVAPNNNNRRF